MGRVRLTLCCRPEPIARVMRAFPKLAAIFLIVHVAGMIYTVAKPAYTIKAKDGTTVANVIVTRDVVIDAHPLLDIKKNDTLLTNSRNKTNSILLNKLKGINKKEQVRLV